VLAAFLRTIALCVVVAVAVETAQCPLDQCGDFAGGKPAGQHAIAAAGACHNCICIGTTWLLPTRVVPPEAVTVATLLPLDTLAEAHPSEPFLPPRFRA
jgi:hypothetical protein